MILNYHHLHYFHQVIKEGGVSAAARKLRISQSAITIQIKKLSENLGVVLLKRSGRNMILTDEGRRVLEYAESIFKLGTELTQALKENKIPAQKKFSIGVTGGLSKNLQVHLIEPFLNDSSIELQMIVGELEDLFLRLQDHRLDLVITHQIPNPQDLKFLKVSEIARSTYVIAKHRKLKLTKNSPIFLAVSGAGAHFRAMKMLRSEFRIQGLVEDVALIRAILMTGKSCVWVPKIAIENEIKSGSAEILKEHRLLSEVFYAVERLTERENEVINKTLRQADKIK